MSKNMIRKSLGLASGVALLASSLASMPAYADNTGPITLLPEGGTVAAATNNSIIGSGLTLNATLNPALQADPGAGAGLEGVVANARYIVDNPDGDVITITLTGTIANPGYLLYNDDGNTAGPSALGENDLVVGQTLITVDANCGTNLVPAACGAANKGYDTTTPYVDYTATNTFETNATKILIGAGVDGGAAGGGGVKDTIAPIKVDSLATSGTTEVHVQALTDTDSSATATAGKVGAFENASAIEKVMLYHVTAVSATPVITAIDRATAGATVGDMAGSVTLNLSLNPFAVDADLRYSLFKDGTAVALEAADARNGGTATVLSVDTANAVTGKITLDGFQEGAGDAAAAGAPVRCLAATAGPHPPIR